MSAETRSFSQANASPPDTAIFRQNDRSAKASPSASSSAGSRQSIAQQDRQEARRFRPSPPLARPSGPRKRRLEPSLLRAGVHEGRLDELGGAPAAADVDLDLV